ncbi:hypothetical protein OH764_31860 [Burkholderia sp. M6-3]
MRHEYILGRVATTRGNNYLYLMLPFQVDCEYFALISLAVFDRPKDLDAEADIQRSQLIKRDKRVKLHLALAAVAVACVGCAETGAALQSLNNGLAQVNQAMVPSGSGTPAMFGPSLSAEQQGQLRSALTASLSSRDASFRSVVVSAQPVMLSVMSKAACYQDWNDSRVLSMYTSSQIGNGFIPAPWGTMKYAPKSRCLSVLRTDSWTQKSLNSFRYRTVYYSPESGESQAVVYEFINQDGSWLLNYASY